MKSNFNTLKLEIAYSRICAMCINTPLEATPWVCVKYNGAVLEDKPLSFEGDPDLYTFALTIFMSRPLFKGSILQHTVRGAVEVEDYLGNNTITGKFVVPNIGTRSASANFEDLSWGAELITFNLNGRDLQAPAGSGVFEKPYYSSIELGPFCF